MNLVVLGIGVDLELAAARRTVRGVTLAENAPPVAILAVARPRHQEVAAGFIRHADAVGHVSIATLIGLGIRVHLELAPRMGAEGGESLGEDAGTGSILAVAVPRDDKVAAGVLCHADRLSLIVIGIGIHLELGGPHASAVELPCENSFSPSVLTIAAPDDDELAGRIHGYLDVGVTNRASLVVVGIGVDLELSTGGGAAACETLPEDSVSVSILTGAVPDDDEVAGWVHGDIDVVVTRIVEVGVAVHHECGPGRYAEIVEPPSPDGIVKGARPDDDEAPRTVTGHGGARIVAALVAERRSVHLEVGPDGTEGTVE